MFSADLGVTPSAANYIEDVFSTYLYTGTGASQTITNGVDLSTKGGLVWIKSRSGSSGHFLTDSNIVAQQKYISSSSTNAAADWGSRFSVFLNNGFRLGADDSTTFTANASGTTYASWTFRKQAKFFDIVTYTGTGVARTIAHNLGSVPGCIIVKRTDSTGDFNVYHRGLTSAAYYIRLNLTTAEGSLPQMWNGDAPTASVFSVGTSSANTNGATYVAYLFAHDAGGFGASGSDNVISCGSFTTDGSGNATVSLGYEPQWVLVKRSSGTSSWIIVDTMRGFAVGNSNDASLYPNLADAENTTDSVGFPNATGFNFTLGSASSTYIYIAIRRGPMKTPTSGTSVFAPLTDSAAGGTTETTGFPVDTQIYKLRSIVDSSYWSDRLRGINTNSTNAAQPYLISDTTAAEASATGFSTSVGNTTYAKGSGWGGASTVMYNFRRAPGFFDVVCYTGTGANRTVSHNLGVAPELMIVKSRSNSTDWAVYHSALGATKWIELNSPAAESTGSSVWNDTAPISSVFSVGTNTRTNASAYTYVAYLFATIAGISKVGSYTGTGTTLQINCGFSSGARFVLIKRRSANGDWYVWDSARGIVAGNDPYLLLNSTAAEVTGTDYIDTYSAGFEISSTAPTEINGLGSSFIFLAIA